MSNGVFFRGVQRPRNEADHSPLSTAVVRNEWSYTFINTVAFMTCTGTRLHFVNVFKAVCLQYVAAALTLQIAVCDSRD